MQVSFHEKLPYFRKYFPPLNSFNSLVRNVLEFLIRFYYIRGKLLQQLFEILYILQIQKGMVSKETIHGNTVLKAKNVHSEMITLHCALLGPCHFPIFHNFRKT